MNKGIFRELLGKLTSVHFQSVLVQHTAVHVKEIMLQGMIFFHRFLHSIEQDSRQQTVTKI
jgi:hypothetical protein